jgi:glycerol-3-phosphate acyltransferase PlsY
MVAPFVCVIAAYLIGGISFAIVASWIFRLPDPRTYGSGNPGATNVLRSGKKAAALFTLIGDTAKGWVAVALAEHFAPSFGSGEATIAASAVAVFLGHLYPVFFGFKGGKGVATALGVLLAVNGWVAASALAVFILIVAITRYVSAASCLAAIAAAITAVVVLGWSPLAFAVMVLAALLIWRHRANLQRLVSGTESRVFSGRRAVPPTDPAA